MHHTNPTEIFREHQLALLREAKDSEEVERRMRERPRGAVAVLERPDEGSWLQILWSTGPVP